MIKVYVVICIAVSFLTILLGLTLIITGSISASQTDFLHHVWHEIYTLSILSIIVGVVAILCAVTLIYCVINQYRDRAADSSYSLIIVVVFATACAVILLVGRSDLQPTALDKTLTIFENYSESKKIPNSNRVVDRVQHSFRCCGVRKAEDWENQLSDKNSTPDSCCIFMIRDCGKNALSALDTIYTSGCIEPIYRYLEKRYTLLIGMNMTTAILALTSCGMGLFLKLRILNRYDVM
jgi:hypothetical protein